MPPSATSIRPFLSVSAPVNAPRTWPNSSDSSSVLRHRAAVDGDERLVAAQRLLVHGLRDQLLAGARLAGRSGSVLLVRQTVSTRRNTSSIGGLRPMMPAKPCSDRGAAQHRVLVAQPPRLEQLPHLHRHQVARRGTASRTAPRRRARCACFQSSESWVQCAVIISDDRRLAPARGPTSAARRRRAAASGCRSARRPRIRARRCRGRSRPSSAISTSKPSRWNRMRSHSRIDCSSSTIRIRGMREF